MADILAKTDFTSAELEQLVKEDEKVRYAFSKDQTKIRANQGHSTSYVRMAFDKAVPPTVLYHGTSANTACVISNEGLKPMNRHHVHLSTQIDVARDVAGRRKGDVVVIQVNAKQMLRDGVIFFRSENNVWLVDKVEPKYLKVIT